MGWIGCVRCKKFRRDFVAQTFALVRPVLQRVRKATKWSRMHPNRTKHTSLQCNVVDRMRSLRKIPTRFRGTNFCTTSAHFAPSFVSQPNGHECTQIVQNTPTRQFRVQWGGLGAFVAKSSTRLRGTNFCTSSTHFARSFVRQPNGPECTKIV